LRRSLGREWSDDMVEVKGQRFAGRGGVFIAKISNLCEESRQSNWVIDSIFELKNIHAGEVTYKWSRTIGR
jgi:hypothetical protein